MIRKMLVSVIYLCALFVQTVCYAGLHDYPNIAVINFEQKAAVSTGLTLQDASLVTDFVIDNLIDSERFMVIEREQLRAITNEHSYNASGLIDLSTATQIGKLNGVKYIVCGSVVGLSLKDKMIDYKHSEVGGIGNTQHTVVANITARFIDVETGRIVLTARGQGASTSTKTEFSLSKKRITTDVVATDVTDEDGNPMEETVENEDVSTQTLTIGAVEVSQVQVHNALFKAAEELVFGKYGFLEKMDNKKKRRK